ncbi:integrase core domain-containing protein [Rhodanobacter sp. 115]|uniref:integrase core domain-containing protein n=1 Tax=Rhodanobacter sp. FW021-MT20 TaxID=1162282 RepID=UPI000260F51F|nr:integrase core domain-containing protein [Rhodanobacter sp. 115]EIL87472.1 putative transposase [Rhodanobacter sp. 115]
MDVWLMKQGIRVSHSRPYHPQTQGKDKRFHRTLKIELLQGTAYDDLAHAQRDFDTWRDVYNQDRPYEALNMAVPVTRYQASPREYCEKPSSPEYPDPRYVRRIGDGGLLRWSGQAYRVGKVFVSEPVEIRPTTDQHLFDVY